MAWYSRPHDQGGSKLEAGRFTATVTRPTARDVGWTVDVKVGVDIVLSQEYCPSEEVAREVAECYLKIRMARAHQDWVHLQHALETRTDG